MSLYNKSMLILPLSFLYHFLPVACLKKSGEGTTHEKIGRFKGRGPQTKNVAFTSESSVSINDNGTCFPGSRSPETEEYHKKSYKASIKQRLMEWLAGLIIENQATEPGQLALLPHEYWPLPHRRDRVMALPADMTLIALDRQQWDRLLLLPPVGSTPPYSIHQQPLYRPPTTPSITPFLTDH